MRRCGPPPDGTRDREHYDRFADFLAVAGPAPRKGDEGRPRTAAERYHLRFLVWRMGPVALELTERLEVAR